MDGCRGGGELATCSCCQAASAVRGELGRGVKWGGVGWGEVSLKRDWVRVGTG